MADISRCLRRKCYAFRLASNQIDINGPMIVMANTYEKCGETRRNRVNSEQLQASCISSGCIWLNFGKLIFGIQEFDFNLNSRCTSYYKSLLCEAPLIHASIITWKEKPLNVPGGPRGRYGWAVWARGDSKVRAPLYSAAGFYPTSRACSTRIPSFALALGICDKSCMR